jgi:ribose 5-phosphate isomerase
MFTGVVEVGLFCDMAEAAYFGMEVSRSIVLSLAHTDV